jgi:hypothetical protein
MCGDMKNQNGEDEIGVDTLGDYGKVLNLQIKTIILLNREVVPIVKEITQEI